MGLVIHHELAELDRAGQAHDLLPASSVLDLQRSIGNRAVDQLLTASLEGRTGAHSEAARGGRIQAMLALGPAGHGYERAADQVARQVVNTVGATGRAPRLQLDPLRMSPGSHASVALVQRQIGEEARERDIQPGVEGGVASRDVEETIQSARGGGTPLQGEIRRSMEDAFGADFSGVRVHHDSRSELLARSLNARAFTTGQDIFFREGEYNPDNARGRELLAHELTHVVQQNGATVQRQIEETHLNGCGCPSCQAVRRSPAVPLQGVPAAVPAIQRDIVSDWKTESAIKGFWGTKRRSRALKAIDRAVEAYKQRPAGDLAGRLKALQDILLAIGAWRKTKRGRVSKREAKVRELETTTNDLIKEVEEQIRQKQQDELVAKARSDQFHTLADVLAPYAKRNKVELDRFMPGKLGLGYLSALSAPRGAGNALTDASIDEMNDAAKKEIKQERDKEAKSGVFGADTMSKSTLEKFMASQLNPVTGMTLYPELKNLINPLDSTKYPDMVVTDPVDLGGVTMQVEHNLSDVNYKDRLKLIADAVSKIQALGFKVPALHIHLPKFGRAIALTEDKTGGEPACEVSEKSSRAVFIPPAFLHLSSEILGNPTPSKVTNPLTGQEEFQFSSTGFDPSGVATVVHEFGHALHYTLNPDRFHGLWGTSFATEDQVKLAAGEVSTYGNKPREFVAEVFLGLVYGKSYSDNVLKMYKAFGGPIPPSMGAKFAKL